MTDAEIAGIMGWRGPGAYTAASMRKVKSIVENAKGEEREALRAEFDAYKEGSEEAFGVVVEQKKALADRVAQLEKTIRDQGSVICDFREQLAASEKSLKRARDYSGCRETT